MTAAGLLSIAFQASLFLIVLGTGMSGRRGSATMLFREPTLLLRSIVSMQLLAPLIILALGSAVPFPPGVKIALVMLALSPVPPFLPKKELETGGQRPYVISLLAVSAVLSVFTIPASLAVLDSIFGLTLAIPAMAIARQAQFTVVIPLALGVLVQRMLPAVAAASGPFVAKAGTALLIVAVVPQLAGMLPAFRLLAGDGTLLAIASSTVLAMLAGHVLGAPVHDDRNVLALSTASRHPGIAIALAQANFASEQLAVPAVFMSLIVGALAALPYAALSRRRFPASDADLAPLHQRRARRVS
jgi:bile acid:Na+ symporter, BASS family